MHCSLLTLAMSRPDRAGEERETSGLVFPSPKQVCSFGQAASNETKLLQGCLLGILFSFSLTFAMSAVGNNCWGPGEASNDSYFLVVLPPIYVNVFLCSEYVVH